MIKRLHPSQSDNLNNSTTPLTSYTSIVITIPLAIFPMLYFLLIECIYKGLLQDHLSYISDILRNTRNGKYILPQKLHEMNTIHERSHKLS